MQLSCPKCGTRDARVSHRRTVAEVLRSLVGIYQLRCRRCRHRWETSAWAEGAWKYAHCPRCYRQELTTWSEQYYHPPHWITFLLRIGATPYRCAACRCNFASFRRCKERFSWRHKTRVEAAPQPESAAAGPAESQAGEAQPVAGEAPETLK
jgi:hypothetical protein